MGGIYWLMVRRGEIKEREKRGIKKKLDISSGASFLCVFIPVRLLAIMLMLISQSVWYPLKGGYCKRPSPGALWRSECIQWLRTRSSVVSWNPTFLLFSFTSKVKVVWKISRNIFAQGAPVCEEELRDAYALQSLCVYKMQAQHFSLSSSFHRRFSL